MELRRRKKDEEKAQTEEKIKKMQVGHINCQIINKKWTRRKKWWLGKKIKGEEKKGKGKGGRKKGKKGEGKRKWGKKEKNKGWGKYKKEKMDKRDGLVYSVLHSAIFLLIC